MVISLFRFQCSQSSRGWWNKTAHSLPSPACGFQCSQSSRGWWNPGDGSNYYFNFDVSVLSVEPWLVERYYVGSRESHEPRFQCSQSSRGWWNMPLALADVDYQDCFSALSRAVVGGTSLEPHFPLCAGESFGALSRAVVGGTHINLFLPNFRPSFSALSRAVVGGTLVSDSWRKQRTGGFSALSRAVVGGTE